MPNPILPLLPNPQTPSLADIVVKGEITGNLPARANFKIGDDIFLQMIIDDLGKYSVSIDTSQPLPLPQKPSLLDALNQSVAPEQNKQESPITLTRPLNLPVNQKLPVAAKIVSTNNGAVQIKLTTINNLPVDKFISKPPVSLPTKTTDTPPLLKANMTPPLLKGGREGSAPMPVSTPAPALKTINLPLQTFKPTPALAAKLDLPQKPLSVNISLSLDNEPPATTNQPVAPQQNQDGAPFANLPLKGTIITQPNQPPIIRTSAGDITLDRTIKLPLKPEVSVVIKNIILPQPESKTDTILDIIKPLLSLKGAPSPSNETIPANPPKDNIPNLYRQVLSQLPATNGKMLSNMVNFIKAAQSKDVGLWLGQDTVRAITARGPDGEAVVAKLNNFVNNAEQRPALAWRVIEVPFFHGGAMSSIRVSIKENFDEDTTSTRKKKAGTRFLVDTDFSRLGKFQFDGFAVEKERRFDLVIRTSKPVEDDLYANILRLYKTTLHELNYVGSLKINVKENFIKIADNETKESKKGIYI